MEGVFGERNGLKERMDVWVDGGGGWRREWEEGREGWKVSI